MTLPVGQISLSQVNVELQQGATTTISLNQTNVRSLAGVPSGQISMSNLQGKSFYYFFNQTISSNTVNYDLRSAAVAAGWNQTTPLNATVTINGGVYVYASSTGVYAFTVTGSFPAGSILTVINNGAIVGYGGRGGNAGYVPGIPSGANAAPGAAGGPALFVSVATTVTNNGTIGGGGGGGGGGAGGSFNPNPKQITSTRRNGGGGGGGRVLGAGGTGGSVTPAPGGAGAPGGTATLASAGGGGAATTPGGAGGGLGSSGSAGGNSTSPGGTTFGGGGGGSGAAVVGNGNITWPAFGSRLGPIS